MATSTILEPIKINSEHGAEIIVQALENAENIKYKKNTRRSTALTTDPDKIREVAAKAMARALRA